MLPYSLKQVSVSVVVSSEFVLAWSYDTESYPGGSIATDGATHPRQVKVMTQTKWDTLVLQIRGWALG